MDGVTGTTSAVFGFAAFGTRIYPLITLLVGTSDTQTVAVYQTWDSEIGTVARARRPVAVAVTPVAETRAGV